MKYLLILLIWPSVVYSQCECSLKSEVKFMISETQVSVLNDSVLRRILRRQGSQRERQMLHNLNHHYEKLLEGVDTLYQGGDCR